ncbi:MAG: hypothetical protein VX899_06125 [Myxococcota bacterium]|nr:hypothetical protein [Myxococcota bacterium]
MTLTLLLLACAAAPTLTQPKSYTLVPSQETQIPELGGKVTLHGRMLSGWRGGPFIPSGGNLQFVRGRSEVVIWAYQRTPGEIWGHSFVVLGGEMETLWICPPGMPAGPKGCEGGGE